MDIGRGALSAYRDIRHKTEKYEYDRGDHEQQDDNHAVPHFELKVRRMAIRLRQVAYTATITNTTLAQFPRGVRIWDAPRSAVEGARVVQVVTMPMQVEVVAEQLEPCSDTPQRFKIRYQDQEGWILAVMLTLPIAGCVGSL